MEGRIRKILEGCLNRLSPTNLPKAIALAKKAKLKALERSLTALLKDFDQLNKNVKFYYNNLKDDVKEAQALAKEAKQELKRKKDREELDLFIRAIRKIGTAWEAGRYSKMLEAYDELRNAKVTVAPKDYRKKLVAVKKKVMNVFKRFGLSRLEKCIAKLEALINKLS